MANSSDDRVDALLLRQQSARMWSPDIKIPEVEQVYDSGLMYQIARLENFESPVAEISLSNNLSIVREDKIRSAIGRCIQGEKCWSNEEIESYQRENGTKSRPMLDAYNGSSYENSRSHRYVCDWSTSKFYVEQQSDYANFGKSHEDQANFTQETRSVLAALTIVSRASVKSFEPFQIIKQPGMGGYAYLFSSQTVEPAFQSGEGEVFECSGDTIEQLKTVFGQIFERRHPEVYLATLRLMRAINRSQNDDAVVDLMIALEAMFNPDKQPEITYRLSHRVAYFLHPLEKEERVRIHDVMKSAYAVRSAFVHGSKRQFEFLENALAKSQQEGKKVDDGELQQLRETLQDVVCRVLFKRYVSHGEELKKELSKSLDEQAI